VDVLPAQPRHLDTPLTIAVEKNCQCSLRFSVVIASFDCPKQLLHQLLSQPSNLPKFFLKIDVAQISLLIYMRIMV
jgi:hypothetical protein